MVLERLLAEELERYATLLRNTRDMGTVETHTKNIISGDVGRDVILLSAGRAVFKTMGITDIGVVEYFWITVITLIYLQTFAHHYGSFAYLLMVDAMSA